MRYSINGVAYDVDPYSVLEVPMTELQITSHASPNPYLVLNVQWGLAHAGSFACATTSGGTKMAFWEATPAIWYSYTTGGSCSITVTSVTQMSSVSKEANGTFFGTLVSTTGDPPKTVSNGSFRVRFASLP
jgi:hypothetical protein